MTDVKNIDSILVPREQAMAASETIPADPVAIDQEVKIDHIDKIEPEIAENTQSNDEITENQENKPEIEAIESKPDQETKAVDSPIDEYGNPVEKPRVYTEEEVNKMMRDRFSRGKYAEQPQQIQQQIKQDAKDFTADPNSEESWETQLEAFVERTIEKRQVKQSETQWRANEAAKQADFESKFTTGMNKYQDFHKVVEGKPITNDMLMATRSLDNPAAFVYGASKLHPQELDRISRIADPYAQAAEVGRLHERMIKDSKAASKAPVPLTPPKGDLPNKAISQPSLEDRITSYAKQKRK